MVRSVAFALLMPLAGALAQVAVTITLVVPRGTPADSAVYIAGNLLTPAWRANGQTLTAAGPNRYTITLQLPANSTLEYKFTRGSWETVEKTAAGAEVPNRRVRVTAGLSITDTVGSWSAGAAGGAAGSANASSITGTVRRHPDFASTRLTNRRNVIVYLPPGYDAARDARYPVLYMHDGQNLFDRATAFGSREWEMDETAERLIAAGTIQPLIIVGIYNTGARMSEYTPVGPAPAAGRSGDDYARFLIEELKPFIDRTYRTKPDRDNTGVAGSSLGGLISLNLAMRHPDVFGKAGVISPSLFWNDGQLLKEAPLRAAELRRVKLWVDIGTDEQRPPAGDSISTAVRNARRLVETFAQMGLVRGRDYFYLEVEGAQHNETWWARRADRVLTFLFPK
jgi:predicted alpha/beta superfamily hydrolase